MTALRFSFELFPPRTAAPGLHFYTINQAGPTMRLWEMLELTVVA